MIITEPRWKSYCVETTKPLFSPKHCQMVIEAGREEPRHNASVGSGKKDGGIVDTNTRTSHISWIPFSKMPEMYRDIETTMKKVNGNHFGFDGVRLTEPAQFTVYPKKGFYDWHMDLNAFGEQGQNPIRKISMTCLLSDPSEFTGGDLLFSEMGDNKPLPLKQGQAIFFASFLRHKVAPVKKGVRKSLVMWFGGPPFK